MGDRRLRILLVALALLGAPAAGLRLACAGSSCPPSPREPTVAPFCGLSADLRTLITAGYREGRSPDVLAATSAGSFLAPPDEDGSRVPWPSTDTTGTRVPIVFTGEGVGRRRLPRETTLDAVAPTIAALLGLERPFPEVRSGRAVEGVAGERAAPLGVVIVWRGIGTEDLEARPSAWPVLRGLIASGAGTGAGATGALPVDPVAAIATIGIGATPSQHGVTGGTVRADDGAVVGAVGPGAPLPVLATLAEDLDEVTDQASRIGLVGRVADDRLLIGGRWYPGSDRDHVLLGGDPARGVAALLDDGYGSGGAADVIGVVLHGSVPAMDRATGAVLEQVRAVPGVVAAVAGTGSLAADAPRLDAEAAAALIDGLAGGRAVAAIGSGGVFLEPGAPVGADALATRLRTIVPSQGRLDLADVYPGFSISLARYC